MPSIHRSLSIPAVLILTTALCAQDCPKETFDYPSFPDVEIVQIVLDHYSFNGDDQLVPALEDYDRASTDVSLIRDNVSIIVDAPPHHAQWDPSTVIINVSDSGDQDLLCLNEYYGATMYVLSPPSAWLLVFPQSVNVPAMSVLYEELSVVDYATANIYFCLEGGCCWSQWSYSPLADGTWKWYVTIAGGGGHGGCVSSFWVLTVTVDGVVSLSPDLTGDDLVNADDLATLLSEWGACSTAFGGFCPSDFDLSGIVDAADLAELLAAWSTF